MMGRGDALGAFGDGSPRPSLRLPRGLSRPAARALVRISRMAQPIHRSRFL